MVQAWNFSLKPQKESNWNIVKSRFSREWIVLGFSKIVFPIFPPNFPFFHTLYFYLLFIFCSLHDLASVLLYHYSKSTSFFVLYSEYYWPQDPILNRSLMKDKWKNTSFSHSLWDFLDHYFTYLWNQRGIIQALKTDQYSFHVRNKNTPSIIKRGPAPTLSTAMLQQCSLYFLLVWK